MSRPPTLPVPSFSRPRSIPQSSNPDISEERTTATPQEPLLSPSNAPDPVSQSSSVPQIHTPTQVNNNKHHGRLSEAIDLLESTWFIEIFFLLCSALCTVLIVTFLAILNNTPVDNWHFYFSVNTIVSTLGVVFKSTLLMAVSAALAQGKWTWYRTRVSPLNTFQAIDAGSRDTLESFKLIWQMRGQHLVSMGALVMALGFMVDPFLQAIISDYGRLVDLDTSAQNMTKATIGKSNRFDGGTQCISTYPSDYPQIDTTPDFAVSAALYDGLNAATSHGYRNVSFTCVSGNCTWAEYASLGVRSTCFDVSSLLKRTFIEDVDNMSTSTLRTSASTSSESVTASTDVSSASTKPLTYEAPQSVTDLTAFSDVSTVNSKVASVQSTVTRATVQSSLTTKPPAYSAAPLLTDLTAFDDVSTLNSEVAPIRSTASRATVDLKERAYSSSTTPPQSSATRTSWTLGNLALVNEGTGDTFSVLQAAVVADPNLTINFKTSQALLSAFTIIRVNNDQTIGSGAGGDAAASAMECGLELALNVYDSSVVNNVLVEHILASTSQKLPESWLPSPKYNQTPYHPYDLPVDPGTPRSNPVYHHTFLWRDDYALDPAALQKNVTGNFTLTQRTLLSTLDFLTSLIRQDHDNGTVKAVVQQDQPVLYTYGSPILQPLFNQTNTTATFDAIARSMSNAIRSIGRDPMSGTTQQWVRYYKVRWGFLALPLSLITIGTVFFVLSIIAANRAHVPTLKGNSIATMIHGPDELLQRDLRTKNHTHSLSVASKTMAKLEWFPEGYALTAGNQPAAKISRPTTPIRDEEEHEMSNLVIPTTPQTPGSNVTLVESQLVGGAEQGVVRPVSPAFTGPEWSDVQIDGPSESTPLGVRRSL